jgi:hypothetical protein
VPPRAGAKADAVGLPHACHKMPVTCRVPPSRSEQSRSIFMKLRLVVAIAALAAMPIVALAQAPKGPPPKAPTKAEIQKVVAMISADKAKVKAYCDIGSLYEQMDQAEQKKDQKKMQDIGKQLEALNQKLGPEYMAVSAGMQAVDPESKEGKELIALWEPLDKQCGQ